MNLYLMATHLSIFVLAVDTVKKSKYSDLKFTVDQYDLFKNEYQTICDSFNDMCSFNNDSIPEDILKYCAEASRNMIESKELVIRNLNLGFKKDFDIKLEYLNEIQAVNPSCLFLDKMLEIMDINVYDVFATVKKGLDVFAAELIEYCKGKGDYITKFSLLNSSYHSKAIEFKKSILDINNQIDSFMFTDNNSIRTDLINRINDFIMKYNEIYWGESLAPKMDINAYNNFMIILTLLKFNNATIYCTYQNMIKGYYSNEFVNAQNIKTLINKLSVEIFMLFVQGNKDILGDMKRCINIPNIKFWNEFNLSNLLPQRRIIDVYYYNLIDELEEIIFNLLSGTLDQDKLNIYKTFLEKSRSLVSSVVIKGFPYWIKRYEYEDFINKIDNAMKEVEAAIKDSNFDRNTLRMVHCITPAYTRKLGKRLASTSY